MAGSAARDPLGPFVGDPAHSALLFDVDGVLAPIVARPSLSAVPETSLRALRALAQRYLLVACVSGRALADLRRLVPVPGLLYAGNHGLELDDGSGPRLADGLEPFGADLAALRAELEPVAVAVGAWLEDKGGITFTLHFGRRRIPSGPRGSCGSAPGRRSGRGRWSSARPAWPSSCGRGCRWTRAPRCARCSGVVRRRARCSPATT